MNYKYNDFIKYLNDRLNSKDCLIIGIDGPGGSGKSYFTEQLRKRNTDLQIIHFDDFYYSHRSINHKSSDIGASFDWKRLLECVLLPLKQSKIAKYKKYSWEDDKLLDDTEVIPKGIIIIEGVYSCREELRKYYDICIWVESDYKVRLERGIERDGVTMKSVWEDEWMPKEEDYIDSHHKTREKADMVICGDIKTGKGKFKIKSMKLKISNT